MYLDNAIPIWLCYGKIPLSLVLKQAPSNVIYIYIYISRPSKKPNSTLSLLLLHNLIVFSAFHGNIVILDHRHHSWKKSLRFQVIWIGYQVMAQVSAYIFIYIYLLLKLGWYCFCFLKFFFFWHQMGLPSGKVYVQIRSRRDMLLGQRQGESVFKRVFRICRVWCRGSRDHPQGNKLHLGCFCIYR